MVICLERGADLHLFQLMPLPLTVSCFSKIQIGFAFLVPAHLGSPGKMAIKRVCVCVCVSNFDKVFEVWHGVRYVLKGFFYHAALYMLCPCDLCTCQSLTSVKTTTTTTPV